MIRSNFCEFVCLLLLLFLFLFSSFFLSDGKYACWRRKREMNKQKNLQRRKPYRYKEENCGFTKKKTAKIAKEMAGTCVAQKERQTYRQTE